MTLYEIDNEIKKIIENADLETGEIDMDALMAMNIDREKKCENIALAYKNAQSEVTALKDEEANFKSRRISAEKKADSLKNFLIYALNGEKFKTAKCEVSFRKSSKVEVPKDMIDSLPDEYKTVKTEINANKTEIKKVLTKGTDEAKEKLLKCGVTLVESLNATVK